MIVKNVTIKDIEEVFKFYKIASDYQTVKKKVVAWPNFKKEMVETEITENRQFKLIINNKIACIWAITFSDEQIWEERNKDTAVYIHRIATNPEFRGNNFVAYIVTWAKEYVKQKNIQFIRLDTLGNNTKLIAHYKNAGFDFLGLFNLKNTDRLPDHYQLAPVCLFEIDLFKSDFTK
ncbi:MULTISPECIES: GNAT family N-acetyltransferase [unclassified Polaribacter]|uniref:GNAT family N-acetyltransferase n=1 Tax=unclassified Polaribacter TaxID=196858 RepID=UPI0011BF25E6|nr:MULTISPECIES: GNAT family N-acetyltransferase [unclassified Polaribacter]TXD52446.1 GNAT family N-acetyltransferase [Polaribacter sp. IC063]TXD61084.1 GNAT family N-acetyltransferase [Polaribacter sp. IC066]